MRVLLPLRKVPANKHTSNSSLSDHSTSSDLWLEDEQTGGLQQVEQHQQQSHQHRNNSSNSNSSRSGDEKKQEFLVTIPLELSSAAASSIGKSAEVDLTSTESNDELSRKAAASTGFVEGESSEASASLPKGCDSSASITGLRLSKKSACPNTSVTSSHLHRKRRALDSSAVADLKPPSRKKRPTEDKKPPAEDSFKKCSRNSSNSSNKMVGGRRVASSFRYSEDDCRDCPADDDGYCFHEDQIENNPASARGDLLDPHAVSKDDRDMQFFVALKKRGLEIREQEGDGNCLFRAVSLQVYGDPSMHGDVRKQCLDFMERDEEHFSQFVTGEPFAQYIQRKRQDGVHGNNPEIQAISELFNRPVEVFCPENAATPLNIFHAEYKTDDAPIRLSYHDGNHYNAVVDPLVPTAGLGLGLPGLQPGLADKMQMAKAVAESDRVADQAAFKRALAESQDDELQRAIKESSLSVEHMYSNKALALSDMDATYFELEQAALERSMKSYSNNEQGRKQEASNGRRRRYNRNTPSPTMNSNSSSARAHSPSTNAVASLPSSTSGRASGESEACIPPAAAASPSVATASSGSSAFAARTAPPEDIPTAAAGVGAADEYPQTVQELVMNGFELRKVVRAYELIGDNFDDLLSFLVSNSS